MAHLHYSPPLGFVEEARGLLDTLDGDDPVACTVDRRLIIAWTSPAWDERARLVPTLVQPQVVGRPFFEGIMPPLDGFYRRQLLRTLEDGHVWRHEYLGPTRDELNICVLTVHPLRGGQGLLLVHEKVLTRPHERLVLDPDIERYRGPQGTLRICGSCRMVALQNGTNTWDFLPSLLGPPRGGLPTVWTLCPSCAVHYERLDDEAEGPRSRRRR